MPEPCAQAWQCLANATKERYGDNASAINTATWCGNAIS